MDHKKKAQAFHDRVLNEGQYEEAATMVTEDVVFSLNQNEPLVGIKAFQGHMSPIQQAFPNLTYTTESILQEGETVSLYWSAKGTHTQPLGEIPATGKDVELKGLSLFCFKDGSISENIVFFNEIEIPKQLGVL